MSQTLPDFLSALPMPALIIDGAERISAANTQARSLIGYDIEGRNFVTILRQPELIDAIEQVLRDQRPRKARYLANDGVQDTTFHVTIRVVASLQVILLCFNDVTHLDQASQMRRDFVANVSHELRTPLTSLMGFIETLRGPARDDAKARDRFLDIMEGEAGRMNRLVGDLLSLSRVEADERVRPRDMVDLCAIVSTVLNSLTPLAVEADVKLTADFQGLDVHVPGDADQLVQVFTNIVENAIKYGALGKQVTVTIETSDREPALRGPGVRVHVTDQGPGIDAKHLPRLSERFYRADSHRSRALGGTGLGLAIVKHIINRHRGRLRVESELGKGARFTVILPLHAATPDEV